MYTEQATWDDVPRPVRWTLVWVLGCLVVGLLTHADKANATPIVKDPEFTVHVTSAQETCQGIVSVLGQYHGNRTVVVELQRNGSDGAWVPAEYWRGAIVRSHGFAFHDTSSATLSRPDTFEIEQYQQLGDQAAYRVVYADLSTGQTAVLVEEFESTRSSRCA
ncbi:hypothetical protein GII36_02565 [Candidatus Mycosynbacter amalyticus]|uniref:Uncharacterized protein n=1 Tax=Candidatus Mycosynbacter amalyticus TaxID=2665156 RepID=A0A857MN77_9BACT|nr:hypothetical protein [Candidatus Mycosynbacter amalyticus]QHN42729.1 hypothetical protein GII36_02565 [Candidatus Mycosynbacter amalyticus]